MLFSQLEAYVGKLVFKSLKWECCSAASHACFLQGNCLQKKKYEYTVLPFIFLPFFTNLQERLNQIILSVYRKYSLDYSGEVPAERCRTPTYRNALVPDASQRRGAVCSPSAPRARVFDRPRSPWDSKTSLKAETWISVGFLALPA